MTPVYRAALLRISDHCTPPQCAMDHPLRRRADQGPGSSSRCTSPRRFRRRWWVLRQAQRDPVEDQPYAPVPGGQLLLSRRTGPRVPGRVAHLRVQLGTAASTRCSSMAATVSSTISATARTFCSLLAEGHPGWRVALESGPARWLRGPTRAARTPVATMKYIEGWDEQHQRFRCDATVRNPVLGEIMHYRGVVHRRRQAMSDVDIPDEAWPYKLIDRET